MQIRSAWLTESSRTWAARMADMGILQSVTAPRRTVRYGESSGFEKAVVRNLILTVY